jgi:hypothetical protein
VCTVGLLHSENLSYRTACCYDLRTIQTQFVLGALLESAPLVSVLAMIWLYVDTGDVAKVSELASSVFWLVLPSLALFIALPLMLSQGVNFYLSLTISIVITVICYGLLVVILRFYGIEL